MPLNMSSPTGSKGERDILRNSLCSFGKHVFLCIMLVDFMVEM